MIHRGCSPTGSRSLWGRALDMAKDVLGSDEPGCLVDLSDRVSHVHGWRVRWMGWLVGSTAEKVREFHGTDGVNEGKRCMQLPVAISDGVLHQRWSGPWL